VTSHTQHMDLIDCVNTREGSHLATSLMIKFLPTLFLLGESKGLCPMVIGNLPKVLDMTNYLESEIR